MEAKLECEVNVEGTVDMVGLARGEEGERDSWR